MDNIIKKEPVSSITIEGQKIFYAFSARYKTEEDGKVSWYLPAFDMFFTTKNMEDSDIRVKAMAKSFFVYHLEINKSWRSFVLELNRLGFKAATNHDYTVSQLIKHRLDRAQFKSKIIQLPIEFEGSNILQKEGMMSLAS